jgi:phosphopantetheinyl transferase
LKELLLRASEDPDTTRHPLASAHSSLTHSHGISVAVLMAPGRARGIGIDLERGRTPRPESARFFLTRDERALLATRAGRGDADELLRLWTVKEAVFKAHPRNGGRLLLDYELAEPFALAGHASAPDRSALRYATLPVPAGFLTLALHPHEDTHADRSPRERALAAQFL